MYDNLSLWLPFDESTMREETKKRILPLLSNYEVHSPENKSEYHTGKILNLKTAIFETGVSIKGSICKSLLGDNFQTLTRQDTQRAIEKLEDTLKIPLKEAKVTKIEFGQNFIVSNPVESYFTFLGDSNHYTRLLQPNTIYFQNSLRKKVFYNKVVEGKSKKGILPPIWANKHVLRYELALLSRLPKQFNTAQIKTKNLYSESFYTGMVDKWANEYKNINKLIEPQFNYSTMKQPKDFFNQLLSQKLSEIGQPQLMQIIEDMKSKNVFPHKEYYSRLKSEIRKMCNTKNEDQSPELIKELDKKILQVKEYCR